MGKLYDFPNRSAIEDEACEWLVKLDRDEPLTAEELAELRGWISLSATHRLEFERIARLWGRMDVLTELAVPFDLAKPQRGYVGRRLLDVVAGVNPSWAAAVVLASVAVISATWLFIQPTQDVDGLYVTDIGEVRDVSLADGTLVQLNTNSRLKIDFGPSRRQIRLLHGEAYFDVVRDPDRPFIVYAGNGAVEAVGTAFSVYLQERDVKVTVTEGEVDITLIDKPGELPGVGPHDNSGIDGSVRVIEKLGRISAGQSATFNGGIGSIHTVQAMELTRRLAWREGMLMFSGEPLEEVVSEISRYTDLTIEISDPEVRNLRIGGQFKVGETEAMFEVLESSFGIQVTRVGRDTLRLSAGTN